MQAARGASLSEPAETAGTATPGAPPGPDPPGPSYARVTLLAVTAAVVLAADLASKIAVVRWLSPGEPVRVVDHVLQLVLTRNPGAAFSLGTGMTAVFALVAVGVVVAIARTARRLRSTGWAVCLGLLLGGALGNLTDRVFRAPGPLRGHVVDWIQLPHWPVFNLADSALVCGSVLAVLLTARGVDLDGGAGRPRPPGGGEPARPSGRAASAYSDRD